MSQRETSLEAPLRDDLLIRKQFVSPCIAKGEGVTLVGSGTNWKTARIKL